MSAVFEMVNAVEDQLRAGRVDRDGADLVDGFLDEIDQVLGFSTGLQTMSGKRNFRRTLRC